MHLLQNLRYEGGRKTATQQNAVWIYRFKEFLVFMEVDDDSSHNLAHVHSTDHFLVPAKIVFGKMVTD